MPPHATRTAIGDLAFLAVFDGFLGTLVGCCLRRVVSVELLNVGGLMPAALAVALSAVLLHGGGSWSRAIVGAMVLVSLALVMAENRRRRRQGMSEGATGSAPTTVLEPRPLA